jgi:hypothetical protein
MKKKLSAILPPLTLAAFYAATLYLISLGKSVSFVYPHCHSRESGNPALQIPDLLAVGIRG